MGHSLSRAENTLLASLRMGNRCDCRQTGGPSHPAKGPVERKIARIVHARVLLWRAFWRKKRENYYCLWHHQSRKDSMFLASLTSILASAVVFCRCWSRMVIESHFASRITAVYRLWRFSLLEDSLHEKVKTEKGFSELALASFPWIIESSYRQLNSATFNTKDLSRLLRCWPSPRPFAFKLAQLLQLRPKEHSAFRRYPIFNNLMSWA